MKKTLYACSTNAGKLREFAHACSEWGSAGWNVQTLPGLQEIPAPEENGETFEENAVLKAIYYSSATPEFVFADDSGLAVRALDGAPGVRSARFAGPGATDSANNQRLLDLLSAFEDRSAQFVCVIALARQGQIVETFRAAVEGDILHQASSGENGFGYDPLFLYPPYGRSFADVSPEEKLQVSHRGKALRQLFAYLQPSAQGTAARRL